MTRDEIAAQFREADERLERLRPAARAHAEAPLPTGDWRVRDALSHLAARANPVANVLRRLEAASGEGTPPPPPRDIHEINAEQVRSRADLDVDGLIDEMLRAHGEAVEALASIDDATLERRIAVAFGPGELSVGELLARAGSGHERNHLDEVEQALEAAKAGA